MLNTAELRITKTSFDKAESRFRWFAQASSTEMDLDEQNTTAELFDNFVTHIRDNEAPPEKFMLRKWRGGMPYLSISHFSSDSAVAGYAEKVYRDGKYLKACGYFTEDELGVAAYKAVSKSLLPGQKPIRISISWLDWVHRHDLLNKTWDRRSQGQECQLCKEHGQKNISFIDGLIIHLALTRIPANPQTFIVEAEAKMTDKSYSQAQAQDAESIVGTELAQAMAEAEMSKMAVDDVVITKAEDPEDEPEPETPEPESEDEEEGEDEKMQEQPQPEKVCDPKDEDEEEDDDDMDKIFQDLRVLVTTKTEDKDQHVAAVNGAYEKLAALMSEKITAMYAVPETKTDMGSPAHLDIDKLKSEITTEVTSALLPMLQEMSLKLETLGDVNATKSLQAPETAQPPAPINKQKQISPVPLQKPVSVIRRIAMKSVGLPDTY